MSDESAATPEPGKPAAPAPALPIKLLIIVVAAALVAGLGGAFVIVKFMGGHSSGGGEAGEEHKAEAVAKSEGHGEPVGKGAAGAAPGVVFDLDPFIVNLADAPDIRYLKMTIKLEVENEGVSANLATRIPQLRDTILVLLSSKDSTSIRSPQGKFQLRDEITQRINGLLPKPGVKTAYFTDFVVQ
ncbi:MAG: flagellar basal body-associated FliL family protein [Nitrospiraceae bacterium]|nr:flagellar basal body-associated FliL family protein [Nitrospiraceae bacterium]